MAFGLWRWNGRIPRESGKQNTGPDSVRACRMAYLLAVGFLVLLLVGFLLAVLTVFLLHGTYLLSRSAYRGSMAADGKAIHKIWRNFRIFVLTSGALTAILSTQNKEG